LNGEPHKIPEAVLITLSGFQILSPLSHI